MNYRRLGNSGLKISELGLGTMIFGEESDRATPADEAQAMIHRYLEAGGNHIDTANVYAGGRSEEIVGKAVKPHREKLILATKVRFSTGDGPNDEGLSHRHIMSAVHNSLRRLQTDYIDLLYMHAWDPLTPLEESLRAFEALVTTGKVRYIGVSNFKAWQLMKGLATGERFGWPTIVAAQYQYSLVKRDLEYEFSDLLETEGVGLVPWGTLGGGFLSGKYQPDRRPIQPDEGRLSMMAEETEEAWDRRNTAQNWEILQVVEDIANSRGASHSQIATAWVSCQPAVASVILGVRTMAQLEDNLAAADVTLDAAELDRLNQASALPDLYPYGFLERYAGR